ncbi:DNA-(apurinic or apyrimidinic site) lyase [Tanacetum coccineum]
MKRFFQPVKKDTSCFKKPNNNGETKATNPDEHQDEEKTQGEPRKFVTWNANSFLLRIKNNWNEFTTFIDTIDPDVIAIQEVRMPAAGAKGAPKNPRELKDDNNASREEKLIITRALSVPTSEKYNVRWSLSDSKYAEPPFSKHEADGRVIIAEFESFRIMNTYVPNNGWKDEETAFQRRRKWDKRMKEFVCNLLINHLLVGELNVGFYGSDHCPVSLELAEPTLDANNHSEKLNSK